MPNMLLSNKNPTVIVNTLYYEHVSSKKTGLLLFFLPYKNKAH